MIGEWGVDAFVAITSAEAIHERACRAYERWPRDPRIAHPFGRPEGMPDHEWRVSPDVMQALTNASPPPDPMPNPKTGLGPVRLLFGWRIVVDRTAPQGTLELNKADKMADDA